MLVTKTSFLRITAAVLAVTLFSFSANAGETDKDLLKDKKAKTEIATVSIEVIDSYGISRFMDRKTATDSHIDYNLKSLKAGEYTVLVKLGDELINTTVMKNLDSNPNVITVEVLDSKGKEVYESSTTGDSYDLSTFPKGVYTLNVYQGHNLINTNKLTKN